MKRKLIALLSGALLLLTFAPTVSAAVVLNCSEGTIHNRHVEERAGFRNGISRHQGIRMMQIYVQDTAHDSMQICVNNGVPPDANTGSLAYIAIEPSPDCFGCGNDILQIGVIRCGGVTATGCNAWGFPLDGKPYWFWAYSGTAHLPNPIPFLDANNNPINACNNENGTGACYISNQHWVIYRQCGQNQFSQTDCNESTNVTPNIWVVAANNNVTSGGVGCLDPEQCPDVTGTVLETDAPWLVDGANINNGAVACETWDAGDGCGGQVVSGIGEWWLDAISVKDTSTGPGGTWLSPKFSKNDGCDVQEMSTYILCDVSQAGGSTGLGGFRVETYTNR